MLQLVMPLLMQLLMQLVMQQMMQQVLRLVMGRPPVIQPAMPLTMQLMMQLMMDRVAQRLLWLVLMPMAQLVMQLVAHAMGRLPDRARAPGFLPGAQGKSCLPQCQLCHHDA